jgi:hypothetical protein
MFHVLTVLVFLAAGHPPVQTYFMAYPTQYTCDEARSRLDTSVISDWYRTKNKVKVFHVEAACETRRAYDERDCHIDWFKRCSDALFNS